MQKSGLDRGRRVGESTMESEFCGESAGHSIFKFFEQWVQIFSEGGRIFTIVWELSFVYLGRVRKADGRPT